MPDEVIPDENTPPPPGGETSPAPVDDLSQEQLDALMKGEEPVASAKPQGDPEPEGDPEPKPDPQPQAPRMRSLPEIHKALLANEQVWPAEVAAYNKALADFQSLTEAEQARLEKVKNLIPAGKDTVLEKLADFLPSDLTPVEREAMEGRLQAVFDELGGNLEEAYLRPYVDTQGGQLETLGVPLNVLSQMPPENYVPTAYNLGLNAGRANPDPATWVKKADAEKAQTAAINKAVADALKAHGITQRAAPAPGGAAQSTRVNPDGMSAKAMAEAASAGTYDLDGELARILAGAR